VATQSHAVSAISLLADTLARLMTIRESELSAFGSLAAFANIKEQLIQSHERECERLRKSLLDDLYALPLRAPPSLPFLSSYG
jgi:hypothetical protein